MLVHVLYLHFINKNLAHVHPDPYPDTKHLDHPCNGHHQHGGPQLHDQGHESTQIFIGSSNNQLVCIAPHAMGMHQLIDDQHGPEVA